MLTPQVLVLQVYLRAVKERFSVLLPDLHLLDEVLTILLDIRILRA